MRIITEDKTTWLPLILVALASFIITLDSTFMNVSISQLVLDLNTSLSTIQLIICFYTLITASLMLVGSKLQDIVGKKKIFLAGALIYGIGALIASVSQNATTLFIGWSLLEGLGGALMTPATISIISGTYKDNKRTFALAISSAIAGIAAAIGPLFGGVVTTFLSWRFGFVLELLIVVFIFLFSYKIKNFKPHLNKSDFDIIGAILCVSGLISLVLGILCLKHHQLTTLILISLSVILLVTFGIFENKQKKKGKTPLVDISLLKNHNLKTGMGIRLITNLSLAGALFAVSVFLQSVLHLSAFRTGLTLLPATFGLLITSLLAPKLAMKFNHKIIMIIGFILAIGSTFLLKYQFGLNTHFMDIAPGLTVFGLGLGFVISLGVDISLNTTPEEKQSTASGLITTSQTLGSSMGTAIIGCILIIGAFSGLHDAIDTYAPDYLDDNNLTHHSGKYLEKLGHVNTTELKHEPGLTEKIVNTILKDAMKLVMDVTAILLTVGLCLTLTLHDEKIRKKYNN